MLKNTIKFMSIALLLSASIAVASEPEREMQINDTVRTKPTEVVAMLKDTQDLDIAINAAIVFNVPLAKELLNHSSLKLNQKQISNAAISAACCTDDVTLFEMIFNRLETQYRMECINFSLKVAAYNEHPIMVKYLVTLPDIIPTDMTKVLAEYKSSRKKDLLNPASAMFNEQKYSAETIAANKEAAVKAREVLAILQSAVNPK